MAILLWNKKYTETLAETLKRFRREKPEFNNEKVTYAGRLDPMAEGIIPLLTGDDVHKKGEFLGLDKIYRIDFMFGPETDTYDVLGLVRSDGSKLIPLPDTEKIEYKLQQIVGEKKQKYPPYSSKPVQGKPLFDWARKGLLNTIIIPEKDITIFSVNNFSVVDCRKDIFIKDLFKNINAVVGDFRQDEITSSWKKYFDRVNNHIIPLYSIEVKASSGTYMRSIIHELGKSLGTSACSIKITRLKIGDYEL